MVSKVSVIYISLELLIALLSVVGNVLVCWAVCLNSNLQSITNFFVVSLALADIAVGLLAIPFAIIISTGFCSNFHGCLFIACFVLVLTQSSIFSLFAIAVDRYIAIKIPLRYNSLVTSQRAKGIIAVCWILSVIIGLTPMLGWNMRTTNATSSSCPAGMTECLFEKVVTMGYMVYFNFFGCVLMPLLAMLVIYARIFMAARHQLRQMELKLSHGHSHSDGSSSRSTLQREVHAAKSLAIIVGLFALCWLPLHIINCFTLFCPKCARPPVWIMYLAIILSHANSVVNPFIYAYRIRDFRHTFRRIIRQHVLGQRDRLRSGSLAVGNFTTSIGISVVDSSFAAVSNGNVLNHSPGPNSSPGNDHGMFREIHSTGIQWNPRSDLSDTEHSTNGHHPVEHALSAQSRKLCSLGSSAQTGEDLSSFKRNSEIMVVKDCSIVTNVNFCSLATRSNHSVELTEVS
ncbi:adenosine A2a receptor b [Astyanax mexicanus]|uniref:Adenosine receptor A2 n=2 Tax=Astyanax mexicanus TaxID=7994 RepID=A0A3B1JDE4_ASTMX|nr:adenosine A2a receptor b [Astyanax mexicanus]KAG9266218.1 adenosine receptor A2b [Astyanax mexicanus]